MLGETRSLKFWPLSPGSYDQMGDMSAIFRILPGFQLGYQERLPASHLHHRPLPNCGFPKGSDRVLWALGHLIPQHRLSISFITGVHSQSVEQGSILRHLSSWSLMGEMQRQENMFLSNLFCSLALMKGIEINQCFYSTHLKDKPKSQH